MGGVAVDEFVTGMGEQGLHARAVPPERAADVAALFLSRPEVAGEEVMLATEQDLQTFAREIEMPEGEQMATRVWQRLWVVADTIVRTRAKIMALADPEHQALDSDRLIASLSLRFFPPGGQDGLATSHSWRLDVGSLRASLLLLLPDEYRRRPALLSRVGPGRLDFLARYVNSRFPDEPPLPTLEDYEGQLGRS